MSLIVYCLMLTISTAIASSSPEHFQISDYLEIKENSPRTINGKTDQAIEDYLQRHDFTLKLPIVSSSLTFSGRNLQQDEIDIKLNFNEVSEESSRGKKSKLKKIFVPIFVFVLIKAMVLIPLALGILAIKTWNALQLSFVSFVVALAMGVWQLCKKVAGDNAHPQIVAASHGGWDAVSQRRSLEEAQKLAYNAYL